MIAAIKSESSFEFRLANRERKYIRSSALKALDYAVLRSEDNAVAFIETGGLRTLFATFMKLVSVVISVVAIIICVFFCRIAADIAFLERFLGLFFCAAQVLGSQEDGEGKGGCW